jgi:basic amino acid/polyamine antiporter, APA family
LFDGVGDPLAFIFEEKNLNVGWMQFSVAIAAVVAMTSVMLVFQMGQPRIWMTMSRDGLLPPVFQTIHKKFQTPSFATIVTGLVVGVPIIFTDKTFVLDFTSIATLFAFVLVCGGVLLIPARPKEAGKFHLPYINAQFIYPLLIVAVLGGLFYSNPHYISQLTQLTLSSEETTAAAAGIDVTKTDLVNNAIAAAALAKKTLNISTLIFWAICIALSAIVFIKKYSLIPLLGLTTCLYLLTGMTAANWAWFASWLALGLVVYFLYGYRKSKLANSNG